MNKNLEVNEKKGFSNVFYISTIFVFLFVLWGALSPSSLNSVASSALGWMITNFGWYYMLITAFFVLFIIVLGISPFGKLRLGKPDDRPEYSWISWIGMLFAAGIGVGFVFFGVAEPILYYMDSPSGIEPETREAAIAGLRYGAYHWAFHPWAIFSIVGLTLAYVQFRKDRPALISSAFYPLIGDRVNGWAGQTIDILAVLATCTGVATTFGLSAMQMTGGLSYLTPIPNNTLVQIIIIIIVTFCFLVSATKGIDRGIRILSNTNIVVAGILLLFILIVGPTLFIAENFVSTLGGYISNLIPMSLTLTPFSDSEWLGTNTIFFWAWHIAWSPFMGLFIARISRGRTIREFVAGVLLVPAVLAILWFSTFGGTALNIELFGGGGLADLVTNDVELALFATLEQLPLSLITSVISMILIFIFFITSADSATFVLGAMTSRGSLEPSNGVKFIWGFLIAGTASVLLISGGGGLDALQTASLVAALPFSLVMLGMIISIIIMLKKDWQVNLRRNKKKEMTNVKEEVRGEFLGDVKDDMYGEVKENFYDDMKDDMYVEMKDKVYDDIKDDVYGDMKDNVYDDMKDDMYVEMKDKVYDDIKDDVYGDMKDNVYDDMKEDMYVEMKDKVYDDIKDDVYGDMKDKVYDDMKEDMYVEMKDKVYDDIKDEVYDEMKDKVYDDMKDDMYEEMKDKVYDDIKDDVYADMKEKVYKDLKSEMKEEIIGELDNDDDTDK